MGETKWKLSNSDEAANTKGNVGYSSKNGFNSGFLPTGTRFSTNCSVFQHLTAVDFLSTAIYNTNKDPDNPSFNAL